MTSKSELINSQTLEHTQEINLLDILQILAKRKKLIFCITVTIALLSVIYSLTLKSSYTATARILPPQRDAGSGLSALLGQAGGLAAMAGGLGGGLSDLYVSILRSRSVADDVIKRLDLITKFKAKNDEAARNRLANKIRIQAEKNGIITIVAVDGEPKQAAELANTFVEELGKTTVRLNLAKVGTERLFLEKRLELVKSDLKKAEEELKIFAQNYKVVQVESQAKASIEGIVKLKAELASKEVQLSVLRSYQTDESPEVKTLMTAIKRLHFEINKLAGTSSDGDGVPSIGTVPSVGLEYTRKMRDVKVQEAVFEQLSKQYELAKLSEAKDSSTIQVLDAAVVPIQRSSPKRTLMVIISTISGFFCSIFSILLLEYLSKLPECNKLKLIEIRNELFSFRKFTS